MTFNVGDRARLVGVYSGYKAGTELTIDDIDEDDPEVPYLLKFPDGGRRWAMPDRIEAIPVEAPTAPPFGISPADLADYTEKFIKAARARVTGVGAEQYAGNGSQKFEHMSLSELITFAREEAQDLAVYAAMLDIRLQRVQDTIKAKGISVVNL